MESLHRQSFNFLKDDLQTKIVLLSGPRQVGKTTLSRQLYSDYDYLNYDAAEDRDIIFEKSWRKDCDVVIFDEIHKYHEWKRFLKGVYDTQGVRPRILVTGSAKLNTYRKMGDSLAGRFFRHRLYPFDIFELVKSENKLSAIEIHRQLMQTGGFPEPFINGSEKFYRKWRKSHIDSILRQDLLDLESVKHIKSLEILIQLLRERVGSPISYASLARDLEHSPITIKNWLEILEDMYIVFSVRPYHKNVAQAILKAPKYYFYDIAQVSNLSARLENSVALSLLKYLHFKEDNDGDDVSLNFIQTKSGKEVDFCVQINGDIHLIEVKQSDNNLSKNLSYFKERIPVTSAVQIVENLDREKHYPNGIKIVDLVNFLSQLSF